MITSIVVGFDGSEAAERALRMACEIAEKFGAALEVSHTPKDETVAFAAEAISGFYVGPNAIQPELLTEAADKMKARAKEIAADVGFGPLSIYIGHGDPADDLLKRAEVVKADLIVTGRRGLGNLRGLLLGSTSHDISSRATCACMTVA
tara:strand:- start:88 stop:534 length:447 start_codon:yes stop_codon:yes gene_type:complete